MGSLRNLEKVARYRLLPGLGNEASALTGKVEVELFRKTAPRPGTPESETGSRLVLYEGDSLALKISHRHEKPLFVVISSTSAHRPDRSRLSAPRGRGLAAAGPSR